jgi:trimeric autotransporter adhesin
MRRTTRSIGIILATGALLLTAAIPAAAAVVSATPASNFWQADGRVRAILRVGNTVYIAGSFTHLFDHGTTSVARDGLAAVNPKTGAPTSWSPKPDGTVYTLAVSPDGRRLYVGGSFHHIGTHQRHRVAAFSIATGKIRPFAANVRGGAVHDIEVAKKAVYIGGAFKSVDLKKRGGLAALTPIKGDLMKWNPGRATGGRVRAIELVPASRRLVVGGSFTAIGGKATPHVAAVDLKTASVLPWIFHPLKGIISMTKAKGAVYAGTQNNLAIKFDPATGKQTWKRHGDGNVQAMTVFRHVLYIGGHFKHFFAQPAQHLAAMDAVSGAPLSWPAEANTPLGVFALEGNGHLYAGGEFTVVTGQAQERFAMFPG